MEASSGCCCAAAADEIDLLRSMLGECADALYGVDGLGTYDALVKRARAHLAAATSQQQGDGK